MAKEKKIVVKLAYDRHLLLDVTQENMKMALMLVELPIYDDVWRDDEVGYTTKAYADEIRVEIKNVNILPPTPED
jgi:hypothetical protein